jgi:DNA-binding response OmpR family regulator
MRAEFLEPGKRKHGAPTGRTEAFESADLGGGTILLITEDKKLHEDLRTLGNASGRIVVRANGSAGTMAILQAIRPAAVVLDLDLPGDSAWKTAELVLDEANCPPLVLLTGRTSQFDMRTAIRAGLLLTKSEPPGRILETVQQSLGLPQVNQGERNAIQRVLIRWLRPSERGEASTSSFLGINERNSRIRK